MLMQFDQRQSKLSQVMKTNIGMTLKLSSKSTVWVFEDPINKSGSMMEMCVGDVSQCWKAHDCSYLPTTGPKEGYAEL